MEKQIQDQGHEHFVVSVQALAKIQDRHEAETSDGGSTGRSDGPGGDGLNIPNE
jgi:hypothetical protein